MSSLPGTKGIAAHRVHPKGQIQLIFGPMFSGKTTELLRRINRFKIAKYNVLLIKYAKDCRYDDECVSTHDRQTVQAKKAVTLKESLEECMDYDVIGVDEGQFFPDILEFAETLANKGKTVIVAALDGTYQREEFGSIVKLVPRAESIIKLSAVCIVCSEDAAYTRRLDITTTTVELIGGSEKYMAVCRECYHKDLPAELHDLTATAVKTMCSPHKPLKTEREEEENQEPVTTRPLVKPMRAF
ncbi:Thymidine kinase, cytosolic [Hypsibius exemplaris]|uniref:Thymidine kinase n=1 Tax=Hypsibius exemplaris TaxID=2072580 RepID=A0A9X6RKF7_HYPEX|nr:Thymidine kinase, cytosolic [Hypsibius exemplaris]